VYLDWKAPYIGEYPSLRMEGILHLLKNSPTTTPQVLIHLNTFRASNNIHLCALSWVKPNEGGIGKETLNNP